MRAWATCNYIRERKERTIIKVCLLYLVGSIGLIEVVVWGAVLIRERKGQKMSAAGIQAQLQEAVGSYRELQQQVSQLYQKQVTLQQQVNETQMVEQELKMLDSNSSNSEDEDGECIVYKLVGPLLVRQDTFEAKSNVEKRLEYIKSEMYVQR